MSEATSRASRLDRLVIRQPDDWHVHLRDGEMLSAVANFTARQFARAIVMPNLASPVTTVDAASAYLKRIMAAVSDGIAFQPLMTCYLTDSIAPDEVERGFASGAFTACKLYPAGATTNSSHGVTNIKNIYPVLETMQRIGMPLLVHGEVTDSDIDIFDREAVFIDRILSGVIAGFPELKIVFEHITTVDAVQFVEGAEDNIAATITPHHLEFSRNAMFQGGIRPHYYCLPVVKRETHRLALRKAATSGSKKFFLGTDSAPHVVEAKETSCGCAGLFNAPHALESYMKIFEEEAALDKFEAFASENGPNFYGLPLNEKRIILERRITKVPAIISAGDSGVIPFHAEEQLGWTYAGLLTE
ncbi:Dihydroorotase [hydrothermal vent metagenome]|uniref:dihydroorotase n=1 Tax=hydrothermal vent metagenome TaxID=652676 RepID=A0A3B0R5F9_9ZZZZ